MRMLAKQLLDLLEDKSGYEAASVAACYPDVLDLDATAFLNPDAGQFDALVLASDLEDDRGQLIVSWTPLASRHDAREEAFSEPGHWKVRAYVEYWLVRPALQYSTFPGYLFRIRFDLVREHASRYYALGAAITPSGAVRFPEAVLASEFVSDLAAVLGEHGAGALFTTTLVARDQDGDRSSWSRHRHQWLRPLAPMSSTRSSGGER